jgi:hypothetical protein
MFGSGVVQAGRGNNRKTFRDIYEPAFAANTRRTPATGHQLNFMTIYLMR